MSWLGRRFPSLNRGGWAALCALLVAGTLVGCGQGSFIGRSYDNFTAYYNTFYNAKQAFEKGLETVNRSVGDIDRKEYVSVFPVSQNQSGGESFETAIQTSADLLREHPNSKWVDDALLLIGKSYYYQNNYVGAAQKFREVIALDAEREGEARFWLAKTLLATDQYTEAAEALTAALEGGEEFGTWTARMHLVRGQLLVRQDEWADAEEAIERGLQGSLPDEVGARGALLLGQVRETVEDYDGARQAYGRVQSYGPRYPLEFAARLSAIEMQGLYGDTDEALQRLENLERGDDTNEMRGEIAIVRARLYEEQGRSRRARAVLTDMLRRDEAPTGATRGGLHYELGTLYRDAYEDFTQAAAHFDTAATTLSRSQPGREGGGTERSRQRLPDAPSDVEARAEQYRGLASHAESVARLDSLLRLGRMPEQEFQTFVKELRQKRLKQLRARSEDRGQQQFEGPGPTGRQESSRSQSAAVQTRGSDAGFLFHQDPTLVQQGRRQFRQTWGDRPLVDNWRRRTAIRSNREETAQAEAGPGAGAAAQGQGDGQGPRVSLNLSAVPRDSASQAEMVNRRAVARYELANALYRAAGRPDSAETWYTRVLEENGDHPVARKALYALAQVHRAQGDTTKARATYRKVIDRYPETPFAERSRQQLGLDRDEPAAGIVESRADSMYSVAYSAWQQGRDSTAFDGFLAVADQYPSAGAAPRALLAAGVVFHRSVVRDSSMLSRAVVDEFLERRAEADSAAVDSVASSAGPAAEADTADVRLESARGDSTGGVPPDSLDPGREASDRPQGAAPDSTRSITTPRLRTDSSGARVDSAGRGRDSVRAGRNAPTDTSRASSRLEENPVADSLARSRSNRSSGRQNAALDSTASPARDSSSVRPEMVPGDSAGVTRDSLASPRDSLAARPDSLARGDSLRVAGARDADSTRVSAPEPDPLEPVRALLTHLTERYPQSRPAQRARSLLEHLDQRAAAASTGPDSVGVGKRPTPAADSMYRFFTSDSSGVYIPRLPGRGSDSTQAWPDKWMPEGVLPGELRFDTNQTPESDRAGPLRVDTTAGPRPVADSSRERWALSVQTVVDSVAADSVYMQVRRQTGSQWPVALLADSVDASVRYRVVIGPFQKREAAERAQSEVAGQLPVEPSLWAVPPGIRRRR